MSSSRRLNLLVISDLHAHDGDPGTGDAPSFISTNGLFQTASTNPLSQIPEVLKATGLDVDWIVTPGDLGDRANPSAQKYAWGALDDIRAKLAANHLFGTTGNHDVDSRRQFPDYDPKSALQTLTPIFPLQLPAVPGTDLRAHADRYWSRNFVVVPVPDFDCTLLILNSSAFHGYASDAAAPPNEHLRGRISPLTVDAIKQEIAGLTTKLNIVLCHHHLARNPWIADGNSNMMGGDSLIESLKDTGRQWLVLHGHQHVPRLFYADSSPLSPIILSAGSVAARTYAVRGVHSRNQIHHLSIRTDLMDGTGAEILGEITSWTWSISTGWSQARADGGLPHRSGFGYRPAAVEMRDRLLQFVRESKNGVRDWNDVVTDQPKLAFVGHDDLQQILKLVEAAGVVIDWDRNDTPRHLELR